MKVLIGSLVFIFSFLASSVASAQILPDDIVSIAKPVLDAIMSGQYALAAAFGLVLLVAAGRKWGKNTWLGTGEGAGLLLLVGSFGGALATALAAGAPLSGSLLYQALGLALTAAGGFSILKAYLPRIATLAEKAPRPVAWALQGLVWVLRNDSKDKAEKAGDRAVAENPAPGTAGIVGVPRDVP